MTIGKEHGDIFTDNKTNLYSDGIPLNIGEREAYFSAQNEWFKSIESSADQGEDVAIAELMNLESKYAMTYANIAAAGSAQDIDRISCFEYANFAGGPDIPVLNGYGNLVATWAKDIPVSLNTRVGRVEYSSRGVSVKTSSGDLHARAVLSTVSNGILAAGDIEFVPALPDWKFAAVSGLPIGTLNKICIHFDRDIFGSSGRGFSVNCEQGTDATGFEASVMGLNTAVIFIGGQRAIWLENQGQQASHDYAVEQVGKVFGNNIRNQVTRSIATAWTTDPWTRGSYACAMPGQWHQREALARPIDDRLFFAGEATTAGDHGCCHGAYRSGIRAAREIAEVVAAH